MVARPCARENKCLQTEINFRCLYIIGSKTCRQPRGRGSTYLTLSNSPLNFGYTCCRTNHCEVEGAWHKKLVLTPLSNPPKPYKNSDEVNPFNGVTRSVVFESLLWISCDGAVCFEYLVMLSYVLNVLWHSPIFSLSCVLPYVLNILLRWPIFWIFRDAALCFEYLMM